MFRSVGLVARFDREEAIELAEDLAKHLRKSGLEICIEDTLADEMEIEGRSVPLREMETDFIITLGGDGTVLRTCALIPKPETPLLTINMGVRGFLTEVEPDQAFTAVDRSLKEDFVIESCTKISTTTERTVFPDALNEVLISTEEPAKLLYAQILKEDEPILNCQADGLMIATQTGSTGYSLSAGGPVLDPRVNAFVLTPVCALSVLRSIVFPADSSITVKVLRPKRVQVVIDGYTRKTINSKFTQLTVTRSKHKASFVRFRDNFYHRLESRLIFRGVGGKINE